jgi:hypothetical protein
MDLLSAFVAGIAFGAGLTSLIVLIDYAIEDRKRARSDRYPLDDRRHWR